MRTVCRQQKAFRLFDRSAADAKKVENFYGTSYSKARNYDVVPDTITYYDLPNQLTVYTANADGSESGETGLLYNTADFETWDKYKAFLRGNNGYSVLEGNGTGSILIKELCQCFHSLSRRGLRLYRDCGLPLSQ